MKAITANRLTDGRVIFRTSEGYWSIDIKDAAHIETDQADTVLALAEAEFSIAVGPYLIDIDEDGPAGMKWRRENIRIDGPSTGSTKTIATPREPLGANI